MSILVDANTRLIVQGITGTAGKFHATFDSNNRMQTLHGAPDSRIVSTSPGEPDKVSVARNLDVAFAPDGGVQKLVQTGDFQYREASAKPDTGGREAFADVATYTPSDAMLLLTGSPRVIDGGVTTTAVTVRINRQTGDGFVVMADPEDNEVCICTWQDRD